ncbi:PilZ domain-containing protein [Cellulomonas sp. ATA003]|uniref:PilZ domain-containing protein n=1 Tax=Cellulomonas sp. ATA003 TaxID=3073064 RepID=UPI002872FE22|nr:PilZ domain-containing protein [Cellulomonas sp. ATA003]WNB84309.1 PilZ domain-containing protein [Cellulomonas sp. ATA003]
MLEGSPCTVLVDDEEVARGVVSVDSGLSLEVSLHDGADAVPDAGSSIVLRTFEESRGRRDYAVVVRARTDDGLVLDELALLSAYQQRAIVRVATDLGITLEYQVVDDRPVDLDPPIEAAVIDLSATGIRVHCRVPLTEGQRVGFTLRTDFDELPLVAEVLRREEAPRGYRYGCRLIGTTQREADALHRYVLSEQIARRFRAGDDD